MARRGLGPAALEVVRAVGAMVPDHGRLVLAVSGGADSMALAAGAAWVGQHRRRRGLEAPQMLAVVVDHGLQTGSDRVAATVADRVQSLGVACRVATVQVQDAGGAGPEAAARHARHEALLQAAGDGAVMMGHTLDDQAETVLLGLARGSGTRSLSGMAPRAGQVLRPLLQVRRATTRAACEEWGVEVWQDPHNADPRFTRVRVRGTVLPVLERELGPGVAEALVRTARLARQDADALDSWAARESARVRDGQELDCAELLGLPVAVSSRIVRDWLVVRGADQPTAEHVDRVMALVTRWSGQGPVQLPGLVVERAAGALRVCRPLR